jgi:hypothetical protein
MSTKARRAYEKALTKFENALSDVDPCAGDIACELRADTWTNAYGDTGPVATAEAQKNARSWVKGDLKEFAKSLVKLRAAMDTLEGKLDAATEEFLAEVEEFDLDGEEF